MKKIAFNLSRPQEIHSTLNRIIHLKPNSSPRRSFVIPLHLQSDLFLSLFEAIQNAFQYSGSSSSGERYPPVRVEIEQSPRWIEARVYDQGEGFDLAQKLKTRPDLAERGRGLFILKQFNDHLKYCRGKKENCLVFRKKILPPARRYRITDLLYEISRRLTEVPDIQKIYNIILDKVIEIFNVERASIMIYNPEEAALKVVAARGLSSSVLRKVRVKKGEGISGSVFLRSRPLLIENIVKQTRRSSKYKRHYRSASLISAPLITSPLKIGEETLGVINVTDKLDGGRFTRGDLKLLAAIANQAAAYIKMGNLIEQLKKTEALRRDLEIVREIQDKLIPQEILSPRGMEVSGASLPCEQGGGDYFDVVENHQGVYLVVADVSGHSLPSVWTMMNFRSAFRALLTHHPSPDELFTSLNTLLFEDLKNTEHFICVALVFLQVDKKKMTYAGAGSPPLFLFQEGGEKIQHLSAQGLPLGVDRQATYEERTLRLSSQAGFLMCTDGVLELPSKPPLLLGVEGVKQMIKPFVNLSASQIIQHLKQSLRRKIGSPFPPDDVTLLVTKML